MSARAASVSRRARLTKSAMLLGMLPRFLMQKSSAKVSRKGLEQKLRLIAIWYVL